MKTENTIEQAFKLASDRYAEMDIDVNAAMKRLDDITVSIHCWQGDDLTGFEQNGEALSGGIQATGNHPGRARNAEELRADLSKAMSLIPGGKRVNLHAIYLESEEAVDRNEIKPEHFANWVEWAKENDVGLDFNPTLFSHPLSADNMTLSNNDEKIREFWIEHCIACRNISDYFGRELGTPSIMNIWIPDGYKDLAADKLGPRKRLAESLDTILSAEVPSEAHKVAVESKLFGIGTESYTVGSNEFYLGYATANKTLLCMDAGHYHPTEVVSEKLSAVSLFVDEMLLHVSRPVRWDSDHVVLLDDETQAIAHELVRSDLLGKVNIGLDFFDASINRIAAWVIGTNNMKKALLKALIEPTSALQKSEKDGDFTSRLALMEDMKTMPWASIWDYYCMTRGVPVGSQWLETVKEYEHEVLSDRL